MPRALRILLASCAGYGLVRAVQLAWVCDDAFISFRYAENLAAGNGLVYNVGERVEGYTNLLWTLLLAPFSALDVSLIVASQVLGIASYAALAALLVQQARLRPGPWLPFAAAWVLLNDDFHVWATGGLETMTFTALATGGLVLACRGEKPASAWAAGACFALLVLTRLDGVLLAGMGALAPFFAAAPARVARVRRALAIGAPMLLTLALWLPLKHAYYGEWLPTAFFSKSVLHPYWSQGLLYVGLFLERNWSLAAACVLFPLLRLVAGGRPFPRAAFYALAALPWTLYLAHVGGDFMFARRLLPAVPLVLLALEELLASLERDALRLGAAAAALVAVLFPAPVFDAERPRIRGIADERSFYPAETIAARRMQAETVAAALAGTPARVAFEGGMCVFGYYSRLPYQVEVTGLTQYELAKAPLAERGRVGHEKVASPQWLRDHGIHFLVRSPLPPLSAQPQRDALNTLRFGDLVEATILFYDDALMDALRGRPGVSFTPIEQVIERTLRQMRVRPLAVAEQLYADLDGYYFAHAGERGRERSAPLRELLERRRREAPDGAAVAPAT